MSSSLLAEWVRSESLSDPECRRNQDSAGSSHTASAECRPCPTDRLDSVPGSNRPRRATNCRSDSPDRHRERTSTRRSTSERVASGAWPPQPHTVSGFCARAHPRDHFRGGYPGRQGLRCRPDLRHRRVRRSSDARERGGNPGGIRLSPTRHRVDANDLLHARVPVAADLCRRARRYAISFFGIVDLLATMPTWISLFIPGSQSLLVIPQCSRTRSPSLTNDSKILARDAQPPDHQLSV